MPVFLLAVNGKGARANLTGAERNELAKLLPEIADAWRANTRELTRKFRTAQ